jgi:RimJ/RimL family protein N-acetyltransferase
MITGQYSCIRTTERDDVAALQRLYALPLPPASLMDRRREPMRPTRVELCEMVRREDANAPALYTVEDRTGEIRGFCMFRASGQDLAAAHAAWLFFEDDAYDGPAADEAFLHFAREAFVRRRLNKMAAHCADYEKAFRRFLTARGFQSDGVQREVYFGGGRWHDVESLSLFRSDFMGDGA